MKSRNLLLLLFLSLLWGPSFVFIKIAVQEIPAMTLVLGRVAIAAVLLYGVLKLRGIALPARGRIWVHFSVMALIAHALPFGLITWGEIYIDSALAAILNGTVPIFTMVMAHYFVKGEGMTGTRVGGIVVGFGGLSLLVAPNIVDGASGSVAGILALTVASASYGFAMVYARKYLADLPPLVAPTAQLFIATIYLLPLALIFERPFSMALPSIEALGSLFFLAVFGTAIAFVIYYRIIEKAGATYLSTVTYLMPVIGLILGVLVLDEIITWNAYLGCALILIGLMLMNGVFNKFESLFGKSRYVRLVRRFFRYEIKEETS